MSSEGMISGREEVKDDRLGEIMQSLIRTLVFILSEIEAFTGPCAKGLT